MFDSQIALVEPSLGERAIRCHRCGRVLTNPKSIARGYGPVCWKKWELCKPVRLDVEKGRIVNIEGGTDADKLKSIIKQHNADYISEIGLGTNPEWKQDL